MQKTQWMAHLFIINLAWRFRLISSTLFIASTTDENCKTLIAGHHVNTCGERSSIYTIPVLSHSCLLYLTGMFLRFSNSRELSWKKQHVCWTRNKKHKPNKQRHCSIGNQLTTVNSFPDAFLNALAHLAFLGLRFFLKFLWHFDLQNLNVYKTLNSSFMYFWIYMKCNINRSSYRWFRIVESVPMYNISQPRNLILSFVTSSMSL